MCVDRLQRARRRRGSSLRDRIRSRDRGLEMVSRGLGGPGLGASCLLGWILCGMRLCICVTRRRCRRGLVGGGLRVATWLWMCDYCGCAGGLVQSGGRKPGLFAGRLCASHNRGLSCVYCLLFKSVECGSRPRLQCARCVVLEYEIVEL